MNVGTRRVSALGISLAAHVVAAIAIAVVAPSLKTEARRISPRPPMVFVSPGSQTVSRPVAPSRIAAVLSVSTGPAVPAVPDDLNIPLEPGNARLSQPGFVFDFEKIVKRATQLFPFVTGSRSLELLDAPPRNGPWTGVSDLLAFWRGPRMKPPLELSDGDLQALIDRSWSRRDRWRAFEPVAVLASKYDADTGRLSAVLREYGTQNGLQPFAEAIVRDPRMWAQLGLAADHADFIELIGHYAAEQPSSRATTELRFLLDQLARASLDALLTLVAIEPEADLRWTLGASHHAFSAIVTIRDYYRLQLERRELESPRALTRYYEDVRLAILGSIVRTTPGGYRASDARFLMGEIFWQRGRWDDAVGLWSEMTPDPASVYAASSGQLLEVIEASRGRLDVRRINGILDSEQGRWQMASQRRLRRFGYQIDTF